MQITVIGGSGFIGTRLVELLLESGYHVKIADKCISACYPDICTIADVRDEKTITEVVAGSDAVVNLAAEHKDNVQPRNLYDEVNIKGAEVVCRACTDAGISKIIFTSSVAVYGFAPPDTDEYGEFAPFNNYGRTKLEAEKVYRNWQGESDNRSLVIVRPTVVFGENNRGNVYNLLKQITNGRFVMIGRGKNKKSMAYVDNVASFLAYSLKFGPGVHLFNYVDKPDMDMNSLVSLVRRTLGKYDGIGIRIPYPLGYLGGLVFDLLSKITGKEYPVSSIRVKKFCSTTQFSSSTIEATGFKPPVSLEEGLRRTIDYEFLNPPKEKKHLFYSE